MGSSRSSPSTCRAQLEPAAAQLPSRLIDYSTVLVFLMVAVSATVLTGWAGQLSLGQFAFVALGAYLTAYYSQSLGYLVCVLLGTLWGIGVAIVIGIPALRVRGLYLGIITLGFALTVSGFRRKKGLVVATFAPFEVRLLRQFVYELVLLLQAEAGAGASPAVVDESPDDPEDEQDEFEAITALSGLDPTAHQLPSEPPEDPVIARLFPAAYLEDDESAAEFRRFTQDRLVERKHESSHAVLATLPEEVDLDDDDVKIELDLAAATHWLGTLNDVRLALGVRLGVEQDDDDVWDALPDDDPRGTVHEIYQWLAWVQDTLLSSLPRPKITEPR